MSTPSNHLIKIGRAAIVAVTLAATGLAAVPAQAQSQQPSFSFNFQIPGSGGQGGGLQFGFGNQQPQHPGGWRGGPHRPGQGWQQRCLTDQHIRSGLARYGFSRVEIRRPLGRDRVEVNGVYRGWLYSMRVDRCTGQVDNVRPIRRVGAGGGFGWHFQFGN